MSCGALVIVNKVLDCDQRLGSGEVAIVSWWTLNALALHLVELEVASWTCSGLSGPNGAVLALITELVHFSLPCVRRYGACGTSRAIVALLTFFLCHGWKNWVGIVYSVGE